MWKRKYITKKLAEFFRSMEEAEELEEKPQDDPPVKTYIYGGQVEEGRWL